jgi:preprotein translocase subunit SecE
LGDVNKMAVTGNVKVKETSNQKGIVKFFKELKAEAKRITWPSKKDIKKATIAVVSFSFLYVIFVGLLDYGFNNLYKLIFK